MAFHLRVCQPLSPQHQTPIPTTYVDIDPLVTSMQFTTVNPGGFGALNVGMQAFLTDSAAGPDYGRLDVPIHIPPRAHVELYAGTGALMFAGAVMTLNKNSSGQADGFIAQGYGLVAVNDDYITSTEITPKTSGVILAEALGDAAPLLNIGPNFVDPGVYHLKSEFHGLAPADIINQIIREGGAVYSGIVSNAGGASGDVSNGVWDFLVYENRTVIFQPRVAPADIDYLIGFDDRVQWVEDYNKLVGQVGIRFTNLDGNGATALTPRFPAINDPLYLAFISQFGFMRAAVLEGGRLRSQSAGIFAQNFIAARSQPSYAVRISRAQQQGMERGGYVDMPPYLVRAGQWVQIGDQQPLPIVQTTYDAFSEVALYDCGDALPHGLVDNRAVHRAVAHLVRGTNPTTGAKVS